MNGSHKKVAEKISEMMKTNYFGGRVLEEHHNVNVVISIILLCPKGTYCQNGEFPKLILTLVILPLQQFKSQAVVVLQQIKKRPKL